MDYIAPDDTYGLRIGALASIYSVAHSPLVKEKHPILSQSTRSIASIQVQNRGTLAGNICNAVPSADSAPALLCLGAKVASMSPRGERQIDIEEFFAGPNKTVLEADELVKEIRIPDQPEGTRGVYIKLSPRSRMDLAVVGVAVMARKADETVPDIRIGLGAVAPRPIRAFTAEETLRGVRISDDAILEASKRASEESAPIDDHRASAEYRRMMVEVLVDRALRQTLAG
ncbi:MAG: xanthine dehydrogenase family protein subunit M [Deltaproteobacteria bacterium]|nr:xanthine dehydrogenase family protein subunit M [Deltaproteobacteria bacterium]